MLYVVALAVLVLALGIAIGQVVGFGHGQEVGRKTEYDRWARMSDPDRAERRRQARLAEEIARVERWKEAR